MERLVHQPEDPAEPRTVSPVPTRHFGDDEVRRILQKAAELQERSHDYHSPSGKGLTLDELRQIASEAGIDPKFIDQAAAHPGVAGRASGGAWAGGPVQWDVSGSVDGEIDDHDRERILHTVRSIMGQKGELEYVFGRMEWSVDAGVGPVIIGISSRDGETDVSVSANKSQEAQLFHLLGVPMGGLLGGAVMAGIAGVAGPAAFPFIGLASAACYGLSRVAWKARSRWWQDRVQEILDQVTSIVREVAVVPPAEGGRGGLPPGSDPASE